MRLISRSVILIATVSICLAAAAAALAQTQQGAAATEHPQASAVSQAAPLTGSIGSHADWPKAKPEDVRSIDAVIAAVYDVISGPAGKPRDWDRFRSLFAPDGHLGIVRPERPAANGQPAQQGDIYFLTPQMYIDRDAPFFAKNGFFERAIANRVEEFGNLAHVWSTYESRHSETDAQPFARGINSIQLMKAQGRWWIVSLVWEQEREGLVLPDKYLR